MSSKLQSQAVYLRGTTYLRMPLFGIIPVVTLLAVCAGLWLQQPLIISDEGPENGG